MLTPIAPEAVIRALAASVADVCARRIGETSTLETAGPVEKPGWLVAIPVSGAATGRLLVWFERTAAQAIARAALKLDEDPDNDAVSRLLADVVRSACGEMEVTTAAAGLLSGEGSFSTSPAPPSASPFEVTFANGLTCALAVGAEIRAAARPTPDLRLEAVLEVDLPLVVRFGRAMMPLRTLADLGPGSVVDMGRSPDEPVELLIGERLIARGEVVVVGGNYGVRITELAGNVAAVDLEARAS